MCAAFRPHHRIRRQLDFDRIYKVLLFAADDVLIVNGDANGLPYPRLGLSISSKVGGAVVRNRWKRFIREAFRLSLSDLPPGVDLIVRPQKQAQPAFETIKRSLVMLAER